VQPQMVGGRPGLSWSGGRAHSACSRVSLRTRRGFKGVVPPASITAFPIGRSVWRA
jgi:hypothetical protein